MDTFKAKIDIIGINPFVLLHSSVLTNIFKQAQKDKGPVPVRGTIDGHNFIQTLVKYSGKWRLYINTPMLKACGKKVGDTITLQIEFDPAERIIPIHHKLAKALNKNKKANDAFKKLSPSRQKEIIRYISALKKETSVDRNVAIAMKFLSGKARFAGRDKP
ncbi:MAG: YdeI/OmpD-associated family protein [Bacteroidia bacterium]